MSRGAPRDMGEGTGHVHDVSKGTGRVRVVSRGAPGDVGEGTGHVHDMSKGTEARQGGEQGRARGGGRGRKEHL